LLQCWHHHQSVSRARQLHSRAVAPVAAIQTQGPATQGRELSTLAPLRAFPARTADTAWTRPVVGEGVMSCPRAGWGKSACPVRGAGCGNRSHGRASEAPPDERGGNRYARPTATAPHLDSTERSDLEARLSSVTLRGTEIVSKTPCSSQAMLNRTWRP